VRLHLKWRTSLDLCEDHPAISIAWGLTMKLEKLALLAEIVGGATEPGQ
jgi:hypothetical protein